MREKISTKKKKKEKKKRLRSHQQTRSILYKPPAFADNYIIRGEIRKEKRGEEEEEEGEGEKKEKRKKN